MDRRQVKLRKMDLRDIHRRKEIKQPQEMKMKIPLGCGCVSTGIALDGCLASNQLHFVCTQGKRGNC